MDRLQRDENLVSRRPFVEGMAAATVGVMIVPRRMPGGREYQAPRDTLNVAAAGYSTRGTGANEICVFETFVAAARSASDTRRPYMTGRVINI